MNLQEHIKRILREEFEERSSRKIKLQNLIDELGILKASKAVGGAKNLIKILYGVDIDRYYKENNIEPYKITNEPNLYIDDLLVQSLELPEGRFLNKDEKMLGDFRWTSQGINYRFTALLYPIKSSGVTKMWRVVGSSGDYGFGYRHISKRNTLGKRARMQIFKQIIDKYNLDSYKN
jgi:hypothetical protein